MAAVPTTPITGPHGTAELVPIDPSRADAAESLTSWLIDAPGHTPFWSKYNLVAVRLRDNVPGFPPPNRQFVGATHEILIFALNPEHPVTAEAMAQPGFQLHWLEPVNLVYQVEATDDEVRDLVALMAQAIVVYGFAPEPWLGLESFRDYWASIIVKTLAHARGEVHAP